LGAREEEDRPGLEDRTDELGSGSKREIGEIEEVWGALEQKKGGRKRETTKEGTSFGLSGASEEE